MCIMYLIYNMLSIPVHTFHVFTAVSSIADEVTGKTTQVTDPLYYVIAAAIIVVIAVITFGGIKSVTKFSDAVVPVMAGLYVLIVLVLIVLNIGKVPGFLQLYLWEHLNQALFSAEHLVWLWRRD